MTMLMVATPLQNARKKSGRRTQTGHGGGTGADAASDVASATARSTRVARKAMARRITSFTSKILTGARGVWRSSAPSQTQVARSTWTAASVGSGVTHGGPDAACANLGK